MRFFFGGVRGAPSPVEGRGAGVGGRRGSGALRTSSWQRSTKLPPRRRTSACGGLGLPRRPVREVLLEAECRLRGGRVRTGTRQWPPRPPRCPLPHCSYLVREARGEALGREPREEARGASSHCSSCPISSSSVRPPAEGQGRRVQGETGPGVQGTGPHCEHQGWTGGRAQRLMGRVSG